MTRKRKGNGRSCKICGEPITRHTRTRIGTQDVALIHEYAPNPPTARARVSAATRVCPVKKSPRKSWVADR